MADDTDRTMDPDTQRLFDAADIESTQERREAAKRRLQAAESRMSAPGAWQQLRARLGLTSA